MAGRLPTEDGCLRNVRAASTRARPTPERFYLRMPSFVITDLYRSESYFLR
jgi:hypothetical protein